MLEYWEDEEEDDEACKDKKKRENKKSLNETMQQMQEITLMVQNLLGTIASTLESINNVFNFSVPFLSWLAIAILCIATVVLYYIPLRCINIFSLAFDMH